MRSSLLKLTHEIKKEYEMIYSHRIFYEFLQDDVMFGRMLEYLCGNKAAIDEIVLIFEGGICA